MAGRDPAVEVPRLLESLTRLRLAAPDEVAERRARFVAAVTGEREILPVDAVAQPA